MIWLTADDHFNNRKILEYCDRPFTTIEEMNEALISNWNSMVAPDDTVYNLGDFVLGKIDSARRFFSRLYGNIKVIPGGHDYRWIRGKEDIYSLSGYKVEILPPLYTLRTSIGQKKIVAVLCHYSMRSWYQSHYGSVHFFGHSHCRMDGFGRSCDVGVDCWEFSPISLEAAIKYIDVKCPWEGRNAR